MSESEQDATGSSSLSNGRDVNWDHHAPRLSEYYLLHTKMRVQKQNKAWT